MGSEKNDGTSFPPAEPLLCANGCGFFGTPSNMNLCSKCYRDIRKEEENVASVKYAMEKTLSMTQLAEGSSVDVVGLDEKAVLALEAVPGEAGSSSAAVAVSAEEEPAGDVKVANRCFSCRKKVGLTGFKCKCGDTFCGTHRYAENHDCQFDFKGTAREAIARANPKVKADKVDRF